jgi:hypothetical protein
MNRLNLHSARAWQRRPSLAAASVTLWTVGTVTSPAGCSPKPSTRNATDSVGKIDHDDARKRAPSSKPHAYPLHNGYSATARGASMRTNHSFTRGMDSHRWPMSLTARRSHFFLSLK